MIEALYNQRIKELAEAAHGAGKLDAPSGSALRDSPICGDRVRMEVVVADGLSAVESNALRDGVAAMLAGGDTPDGWAELAVFEPVRHHRSRHGCVLIPFEALAIAAAS